MASTGQLRDGGLAKGVLAERIAQSVQHPYLRWMEARLFRESPSMFPLEIINNPGVLRHRYLSSPPAHGFPGFAN